MIEISDVSSYFSHLSRTMNKLPFGIIDQIAQTILHAYDQGRMIYLFGNGAVRPWLRIWLAIWAKGR